MNLAAAPTPAIVPPPREVNKVRLTLLVMLMFSLLVAGIFRTPPIVFMAAMLCVAPPVAMVVARFSSRHLRLERVLPVSGSVGEILTGRMTIENTGRLPVLLAATQAGDVTKPLYGEKGGRDTWPVVALAEGRHEIPLLRAGERLEFAQTWQLQSRGVFTLPPARAGATDPLGFAVELNVLSERHEIAVLPRAPRLDRLGFLGGSAARMQAPQYASVAADAMDFHGVRPWQPGEAIRRIHWKSTARSGALQVVEWEENVARDLVVLLDTQTSTQAGTRAETLEDSITACAAVARHLLEGGYQCQIFFWKESGDGCEVGSCIGRNARALPDVLRTLAGVTPTPRVTATLEALADAARAQMTPGHAVFLVGSSLCDLEAARRTLRGRGAPSYTLVFDAQSYANPQAKFSRARPGTSRLDPRHNTRVVRRGESIAAALEMMV